MAVDAPRDHPYLVGYRKKFEHYLVEQPPIQPGLVFEITPFEIGSRDALIFNRYRIKPNCLSRTHQYKVAKWHSTLRGIEGLDWSVKLWGNRASGVMVPHLTMSSLTQLALAQRGWLPLHAAACSNPADGRNVLLAGRRGVGKTTLTGRLIKQGWRLVSEDRVYLKDGVVQGLRTPVNMKYDRSDPQLVNLPRATRWRIKRNYLLSLATRGYVSLHEPVKLEHLIPDQLEDRCALSRVVYLQSGGTAVTSDAQAAPADLALRMIRGNEFEDQSLIEDVLAYQFCFPEVAGKTGYLWDDDRERLAREFERPSVRSTMITTPVKPTGAQWDHLCREVVG